MLGKRGVQAKKVNKFFLQNNVLPSSFIFDQNFRNTTVDVYFYLSLFLFPFKLKFVSECFSLNRLQSILYTG